MLTDERVCELHALADWAENGGRNTPAPSFSWLGKGELLELLKEVMDSRSAKKQLKKEDP